MPDLGEIVTALRVTYQPAGWRRPLREFRQFQSRLAEDLVTHLNPGMNKKLGEG